MQKHKPIQSLNIYSNCYFTSIEKAQQAHKWKQRTQNLAVSERDLQMFTFTCLTGFLPWSDLKSCLFVVYLLVYLH